LLLDSLTYRQTSANKKSNMNRSSQPKNCSELRYSAHEKIVANADGRDLIKKICSSTAGKYLQHCRNYAR
jgi:hypothetical protein